MKKFVFVFAGIVFGAIVAFVISGQTVTMDQCFPVGGGACVRVALPNGADPGPACIPGEVYLDTNEAVDTNCTTTADNSLCLCTALNTWTALENN